MKALCTIALSCLVTSLSASAAIAAPTPEQILDNVDDLYRGTSAHGTMTMKVKTENFARELKMEFWSQGEEKSLVKILSPKKEKGTATLRVEKNIWNYLPKVKRVIKVPSSMMGGSWMGSHFTNNDLVRSSRMSDDYTFELSFDGERDGKKIYEVTCIPKPDAPVVWGKIVVEVTHDKMPTRLRYFDEDMELARTMTYSDIKKIGARKQPTRMRIIPAEDPDEFTEMHFADWKFDVSVDDSKFSLRSLQR